MIDLQGLTDELCETLGRSVAVDNEHFEFITVSAQIGVIDRVREDIILNRRTGAEVVAFIESQRVTSASEPVLVPGSEALGSLPRWCFPIRTHARLHGLLWIINTPELSEEERATASQYADRMRDVLATNLQHADANLRRGIGLATALLVEGRQDALAEAHRDGLLLSLGPIVVWSIVLDIENSGARALTTADLLDVLADLHVTTLPGSFLAMPSENRLSVVTRMPPGRHDSAGIVRAIERSCRRKRLRIVAAGSAAATASDAADEAHERAVFAASVAHWEGGGAIRDWSELGSWVLLKDRPLHLELVRTVSPAAAALITGGGALHWETVLAYLDHGCDVPATTAVLHIQRATLYYRLNRAKAIAGAEILEDGWMRTSAHVALRVWRACTSSTGRGERARPGSIATT